MNKTPQKLSVFAQVRSLPRLAAVAFSATLLERQMPNFRLFCDVCEFETEGQMDKALVQIWLAYDALRQNKKISTNMGLLREKVEEITPDAAHFDSFGVYPAIDCAMAMVATLNLLSNDDPTGAVVVSKLSQGSVEAVILATEGELDNAEIKSHPLMQREIDFQQRLLATIEQRVSSERLKALAQEDEASNVGIPFEDA